MDVCDGREGCRRSGKAGWVRGSRGMEFELAGPHASPWPEPYPCPSLQSGADGSGACGYGTLSLNAWPYDAIAVVNPLSPFLSGSGPQGCGACLEVQCYDEARGEGMERGGTDGSRLLTMSDLSVHLNVEPASCPPIVNCPCLVREPLAPACTAPWPLVTRPHLHDLHSLFCSDRRCAAPRRSARWSW